MAINYTINFYNQSTNTTSFVIYQRYPGSGGSIWEPLSWRTAPTYPSSQARITWEEDYSFVWSETGRLSPGVEFRTSQIMNADPSSANAILFNAVSGVASLSNLHADQPAQQFKIQEGASIPPNTYAVGIGMAGKPACAMQAEPNLNIIAGAEPEYWVSYGNYQEGQVLDLSTMTNSVRIDFSGSNTKEVTLSEQMSLSVK